MAQRRRRRARCMLHCPQRHVLGMRGWISSVRGMSDVEDPIEVRGGVPRVTATGTGVLTPVRTAVAQTLYPDRTRHPRQMVGTLTRDASRDTVRSEICWHLLILPSKFSVNLRRQPTVPFCFIGRRTSDSRVSFRSRTHSSSTNPSFPSTAFLRRLFASSCKKLPLNLCIERRVDDDFSYRNSSRLGLQLTRFS